MLALLAVFNIFNYKFDATNTANVASVLAYFHYSIGKRLWPHPPEVLEAMRIKTGKEPQKEKEEDAKENTVNADKRGVEPLDVDSETGMFSDSVVTSEFSWNHQKLSFQKNLDLSDTIQRTRRKKLRRHLLSKMMPSWQRKKPLKSQVRQIFSSRIRIKNHCLATI